MVMGLFPGSARPAEVRLDHSQSQGRRFESVTAHARAPASVPADDGEVERFVQTPLRGMASGLACVIHTSILVSRRNLAPLAVMVAAAACAGSAASGPASAAGRAANAAG